jgi:spore coat polysaccharide biosynthesis protein SpsF
MSLPLDSDTPILVNIVNQLKKIPIKSDIFIATSSNNYDDDIEKLCKLNQINCFRGSENDVLSRFVEISKEYDTCVRLTGDNPIVDIEYLKLTIESHLEGKFDYTSTTSLPIGMNFEIVNSKILQQIAEQNISIEDKEHVTLYIKKAGTFNTNFLDFNFLNKYQNVRLTIDYPTDYLVLSSIVAIGNKINLNGLKLVDYVFVNYPWILEINKDNYQKSSYKTIEEEFEVASPILDKFEFLRLQSFLKNNIKNGI